MQDHPSTPIIKYKGCLSPVSDRDTPTERCCSECLQTKPLAEFESDKRSKNKNGFLRRCRRCVAGARSARRRGVVRRGSTKDTQPEPEGSKCCSRCLTLKPLNQFPADPRYRRGVTGWCMDCRSQWNKENKRRIRGLDKPGVETKICAKCGEEKPHQYFYRCSTTIDGLAGRCIPCTIAGTRWTPNPGHRTHLMSKYGLTNEKFAEMLIAQSGRCEICERPMRQAMVDHDHNTGSVRALLCARCNNWLAGIESEGFVESAAAYLKKHSIAAANRP